MEVALRVAVLDSNIDVDYMVEEMPGMKIIGKDEDPDALFVRSANLHNFSFLPSTLAVCRSGSGVDNIPIERCNELGIAVFNAPGANAYSVKELTIAMMVVAARKVIPAFDVLRANPGLDVEKEKSAFRGEELRSKKILVIGLGSVGSLVARGCLSMGMEVFGFDPYVDVNDINQLSDLNGIDDFDIITFHPELNEETEEMVNKDFLGRTKTGVMLVNFARGEIVSESDVLCALESKHLGCYVTDFPSRKLLGAANRGLPVLCTPHLGGTTKRAEMAPLGVVVQKFLDFWSTGRVEGSVNFPELNCSAVKTGVRRSRFSVVNINTPGMLSEIHRVVSRHGYNISSEAHETRGPVGYGVFDVDNSDENINDIVAELKNVFGITKVRIIG